jgi:hypothetical protein
MAIRPCTKDKKKTEGIGEWLYQHSLNRASAYGITEENIFIRIPIVGR